MQIARVLAKGLTRPELVDDTQWLLEACAVTYVDRLTEQNNQLLFLITLVHMCRVMTEVPNALHGAVDFFSGMEYQLDEMMHIFTQFGTEHAALGPDGEVHFVQNVIALAAMELLQPVEYSPPGL